MGQTEEKYRQIRLQLDALGYYQPLSVHSIILVEKLLNDLCKATSELKHYKALSEKSLKTACELKQKTEPYKQINSKVVQQNKELHKQLLQEKEDAEDVKRTLKKKIRGLENEKQNQEFLCIQHLSRIGQLEKELAETTVELAKLKGTFKATKSSVLNTKKLKVPELDKNNTSLLNETATLRQTVELLIQKLNVIGNDKSDVGDAIKSFKNKVDAREKELQRLSQMFEGGIPVMAANKDCCCCPGQAELQTKVKMLEEQLQDCQEKRHEAMRRAVNLAKRNQSLEQGMQAEDGEDKGCCCAENSKKLCKLQEKLDCRQIRIDQLENCVDKLNSKIQTLAKEKNELNTIVEQSGVEKKKLSERINELNTIETDLMKEIERLKRINAEQKSQLAELEARTATALSKETTRPVARFRQPLTKPLAKEKPDQNKLSSVKSKVVTKYVAKSTVPKKQTQSKVTQRSKTPMPQTTETTQSSRSTSPGRLTTRSPSPNWKEQLEKERQKFEAQIAELNKKNAEHCAQYHSHEGSTAKGGEAQSQWLLLERVQAERDYYHKEFSRLRDQLNYIPDHSTEESGMVSPNRKLEKLITERDCYHKEVCQLKKELSKATVDKAEINELHRKLGIKEDELMEILNKLQELGKRQDMQDNTQVVQSLKKQLNEKEEELRLKDKKIQDLERNQILPNFIETNTELWTKLNLKEEEILLLREKIRDLETKGPSTNKAEDLQRRLRDKENELAVLNKKLEFVEKSVKDVEYKAYLQIREFSSTLDDKSKENARLQRKIQDWEREQRPISNNQAIITRLEIERDNARSDLLRMQEERNALRNKLQMITEEYLTEQSKTERNNAELESRVCRLEMERNDLINREVNLQSEVRIFKEQVQEYKEKMRSLSTDLSSQRSGYNHIKLLQEQTDRALCASQDILTQTESELTSTLHRLHELEELNNCLQREIADLKNDRSLLKSNMAQIDQEKDALLLKVDEKTELNVGLERELQTREKRIAQLEDIVADLKKKLDMALDSSAHSEQNLRQALQESTKLRQHIDKLERTHDNILRENRRLQDDLASATSDCQIAHKNLEESRREAEDLKLQLQGYVAEVRRVEEILQQKEAERTDMLEQFRNLTIEATTLESNNHSLESEAKSTKSCLRDTQEKLQELEAKLLEKSSLVHGYESQIGELTHQIAKLERKNSSLVEKKQRYEADSNAARDLSSNLECQRQCLAQQLTQAQMENKRLEADLHQMQSELCELRERLGQERKNSATLETVLAASRQETLQRNLDNNDLKSQVHCLQTKISELQDKLEHGTDALRRCQIEANEYQSQVAELRREITNERFERARAEEERSYSSTL